MSDLEQDLPGTIVCYADMCRFMAQEDVIKERDKRIEELEAVLRIWINEYGAVSSNIATKGYLQAKEVLKGDT